MYRNSAETESIRFKQRAVNSHYLYDLNAQNILLIFIQNEVNVLYKYMHGAIQY